MTFEQIESVLLTGGASRRMGRDKAAIEVHGEALAERIARLLNRSGIKLTVCGRLPVDGFPFLRDAEDYAGPLAAIAAFDPCRSLVFVSSCDLPGFDPEIVPKLAANLAGYDAAVPVAGGRPQPLCALYRANTFVLARTLVQSGEKRVMAWLERLDWIAVEDVDQRWIANVNSPEDLARFPSDPK